MGKSTNAEINVMMFGGRRAGKTSVLAAMEACFEEQFGSSNLMIVPSDDDVMRTIERKQREIESYYGTNRRSFSSDDEPTSDINEYAFDVKLKSKSDAAMRVNFIDYPGEWLEDKNKAKLLNEKMNISNVILIAIDTPYLMEEAPTSDEKSIGQYNDYKNYCKRISFMLKSADLGGNPRMILFVPLKCEKYKNRGQLPLVAKKIKEAYKAVFNIFVGAGAKKAEIAILPMVTIGNAEFGKFERDSEGEILIDEQWGTPAKSIFYFPNIELANKPQPMYCEQPMVYILVYLLEMAMREKKKSDESKNILERWFRHNIWEKIWNLATIEDFMREKNTLNSKMIKKDNGFEIVNNPLNF